MPLGAEVTCATGSGGDLCHLEQVVLVGMDASRAGCPWRWMLPRMSAHRDRGPQSQCCSYSHVLAVAVTVTRQCGTISSTSSGNELCQHQPPQDPVPLELHYPWGFPLGTRHIPALPGKGVVLPGRGSGCLSHGDTVGAELGGLCWYVGAASLEFPRGMLRCGQPGWERGQLHACTAPGSTSPSSSAPTALPPPADNKGPARLCKTDLPALSSVA